MYEAGQAHARRAGGPSVGRRAPWAFAEPPDYRHPRNGDFTSSAVIDQPRDLDAAVVMGGLGQDARERDHLVAI
jgi:hypothetical protein